jgi:hypothetical protein
VSNKRPIKDPLKTLKVKTTLGRTLTKEYLKKMKIKRLRKK